MSADDRARLLAGVRDELGKHDAIDDAIAAVESPGVPLDLSQHHTIPLLIACSGRPAVLILPDQLSDEEAIELAATVLLQLRAATRSPRPAIEIARSMPT